MKLDELDGGKGVLQRMLDAYGFSKQKQLGDMHELSSGTISTWIKRDYFPGDIVVACALDTGVSLRWLATGEGTKYDSNPSERRDSETICMPCFSLTSGKLKESGTWRIDSEFMVDEIAEPAFVKGSKSSWLVDMSKNEVANGRWLLVIDGYYDVYDASRIPNNRVQLNIIGSSSSFICEATDLECMGQVVFTFDKNI